MYCRYCGEAMTAEDAFCRHCGAGVAAGEAATLAANPGPDSVYGSPLRRLAAAIVDSIVLGVLGAVVGFITAYVLSPARVSTATSQMLGGLLAVLYFVLMHSSAWQATLGKRWLGLKVVGPDDGRIRAGRSLGRYFAGLLCLLTLFIGYAWITLSRRRQGFHDMAAGTRVVRAQWPQASLAAAPPARRRLGLFLLCLLFLALPLIAAIVIPPYQAYIERQRRPLPGAVALSTPQAVAAAQADVLAAQALASSARRAVYRFHQREGQLPESLAAAGFEASADGITLSWQTGEVGALVAVIRRGPLADSAIGYAGEPAVPGEWPCVAQDLPAAFIPRGCVGLD